MAAILVTQPFFLRSLGAPARPSPSLGGEAKNCRPIVSPVFIVIRIILTVFSGRNSWQVAEPTQGDQQGKEPRPWAALGYFATDTSATACSSGHPMPWYLVHLLVITPRVNTRQSDCIRPFAVASLPVMASAKRRYQETDQPVKHNVYSDTQQGSNYIQRAGYDTQNRNTVIRNRSRSIEGVPGWRRPGVTLKSVNRTTRSSIIVPWSAEASVHFKASRYRMTLEAVYFEITCTAWSYASSGAARGELCVIATPPSWWQ